MKVKIAVLAAFTCGLAMFIPAAMIGEADMATLNDLVGQIENSALRERIEEEIKRVAKQKKFGLVFEEHLPECTPLWEIPVKRGALVAKKTGKMSDVWRVVTIDEGKAICVRDAVVQDSEAEATEFDLSDLVTVAKFGEPIYPYLKPMGSVTNAPDNNLWHTLIEADNYHALQFLEYIYGGKVDCIYIDPPYNTGAKDWKYNNNYVDDSDAYRHSKWLSMMQKRLALAKKLLNPHDSVLIVTIDEKEYLHLGCLLEEMFPEARIQMVIDIINPGGTNRDNEFSRVEEFIFVVQFGNSSIARTRNNMLNSKGEEDTPAWLSFNRSNNPRKGSNGQFYPIYIDPVQKQIVEIGESMSLETTQDMFPKKKGLVSVFPLRANGEESIWRAIPETARSWVRKGYVRVNKYESKNNRWTLSYIPTGLQQIIESGQVGKVPKREDGSLDITHIPALLKDLNAKTVWYQKSHNADDYGGSVIKGIIKEHSFSFPKSLYAVHDTLRFFVANKPNAIIVDFFAGSGTTLHAVNLLNAVDGGKRQCVMVTNNEVSDAEAKNLTEQGYKPGDDEWERLGIARYVTWPRTVCSIEGHDVKGQPLKGNYGVEIDDYIVDEEDTVVSKTTGKPIKTKIYKKTKRQMYPQLAGMAMADGFKANAAFFKLGFLDKTSVSLGRQFHEMLPTLWMKAGAHGPCPKVSGAVGDMLILPENKFAVLLEESAFDRFKSEIESATGIETLYLVTDYEQSYKAMAKILNGKATYQLYRDYLDNFRINKGGR